MLAGVARQLLASVWQLPYSGHAHARLSGCGHGAIAALLVATVGKRLKLAARVLRAHLQPHVTSHCLCVRFPLWQQVVPEEEGRTQFLVITQCSTRL